MKRFYCVKCKRVKRVQKTPIIIESMVSTNPENRIGECDYHASGLSRKQSLAPRYETNPATYNTRFKFRSARSQKTSPVVTTGKGKR